jgi:hypothetical protein
VIAVLPAVVVSMPSWLAFLAFGGVFLSFNIVFWQDIAVK